MESKEICCVCGKARKTHGSVWQDWHYLVKGEETAEFEIVVCATCKMATKQRRTRQREVVTV